MEIEGNYHLEEPYRTGRTNDEMLQVKYSMYDSHILPKDSAIWY